MSSAPGAKTSKIRRPPGSSSAKAAASADAAIVLCFEVQKGAKRADRELDTLVDRWPAEVAEAQVEVVHDAGKLGALPADAEHSG